MFEPVQQVHGVVARERPITLHGARGTAVGCLTRGSILPQIGAHSDSIGSQGSEGALGIGRSPGREQEVRVSDLDIRELVAEILEQPVDSIALDSNLEQLGWDSLADLNLISIADERFSITVDPKALADSETPADLAALLGG